MTRKLIRVGLITALFLPVVTFAAYNDVTLTADTTVLSVNGITVNVTGAGATLETITVGATNFTVTMQAGSTITVTAPDLNQFDVFTNDYSVPVTCTGSSSTFTYGATAAGTIVVTPLSTLCSTAAAATTNVGGGPIGLFGTVGGGGGGGGGSTTTVTPATPATPAVPTVSPATPATPASPALFNRPLSVGSSGNDVMELQKRLVAEGLLSAEPTGYFGQQTLKAVKAYQAKNGLSQVGAVGPATRALLNGGAQSPTINTQTSSSFTFTKYLQRGSRGNDVTELQNRLINLGLMSGEATGYFGPLTEAAVKAYQTNNGIDSLGVVGPSTRGSLNK